MNEPSNEQQKIVNLLTENESMDIYDIAMHAGIKAIAVKHILDDMREDGYAVEIDEGEWTLIR